jgi:hypothetical protein
LGYAAHMVRIIVGHGQADDPLPLRAALFSPRNAG